MNRLSKYKEKELELKKRMHKSKIFEKDFKESFVKSSGPGGQNVNKVSTCVVLVHVPTLLKVKCQAERNQQANRFKAKLLLVSKIEKYYETKERETQYFREKKKRQNRKKPKVLKEKILKDKRLHSEKKSLRKKIKSIKVGEE